MNNDVMGRLLAVTPEWAAEAGYYGLPDEIEAMVESELRSAAAGDSPQPSASVLLENIQSLRDLQQQERQHIEAYRTRSEAVPAAASEETPGAFRRVGAISVALAAAMLGVGLQAVGFEMTWNGWGLLLIAAALAALNLGKLCGWPQRGLKSLRDYCDYRRALLRCRRLDQRIQQTRLKMLDAKEDMSRAEQFIALNKGVVLAHYRQRKALAQRAAQHINQP